MLFTILRGSQDVKNYFPLHIFKTIYIWTTVIVFKLDVDENMNYKTNHIFINSIKWFETCAFLVDNAIISS